MLLVAACAGAPPEGADAPATRAGAAAPAAPTALTLGAPVLHLGQLAREPMFVEHPDGTLFLSGYGSQVTGVDPRSVPFLWKSVDGGATWVAVDVGTAADGAIGNSDVDLAIAPDGTLYFAAMGFDRSAFEGVHVAIGASRDGGATWSWSLLSEDRFDDRPWVEVAPNGTAHAVWNDGAGVSHAVSTDGGATWVERERIHPRGGSSHLAIGPAGEIAVRVTPLSASGRTFDEGLELVAVSTDGGETWAKHPAPGTLEWDPTFRDPTKIPRWVEPIAWDAQGALYSLWSAGTEVRLARSVDRGATWREWTVAADDEIAYFPYLVARGEGELAATWFTGGGDAMAVRAALIRVPAGGEGEPTVLLAEPFQIDVWRDLESARARDPGGEYLPVAFLSDGDLGVAAPVQDARNERFGFSWRRLAIEH